MSITGAFFSLFSYFSLVCSETRDHSLSRLIEGQNWLTWLGWTWKFLMPTWKKRILTKFPSVINMVSFYLSKVTRMVLVKVDSVMVLTSSITATTRMLAVLTNTTVSVGHMASELPGLLLACTHVATELEIIINVTFSCKTNNLKKISQYFDKYYQKKISSVCISAFSSELKTFEWKRST